MPTNFPTSIDSLVNPTATSKRNAPSVAGTATNANDAITALETKVGADSSAVTTTLDYKVRVLQAYSNTVLADTGAVNAAVLTPSPAIAAYAAGQTFVFTPTAANTAASTVNVSGLGTKAVQYGGQAIPAGFLSTVVIARIMYDGTAFQLMNPATNTLAYAEISSTFSTTTVTTPVSVTSLSISPNCPAGRRIGLEVVPQYVDKTTAGNITVAIFEGATQIAQALVTSPAGQPGIYCTVRASFVPSAGSHTYNAAIAQSNAGTVLFEAAATSKGYIKAYLD